VSGQVFAIRRLEATPALAPLAKARQQV